MLQQDHDFIESFGRALVELPQKIKHCKTCHNLSETDLCAICENPKRSGEVVCVVQDIRDVIAIENTGQFSGKYHVLGGIISPMEGIGPSDLKIETLLERLTASEEIEEVIMALPSTMEGDTTAFYLFKKLQNFQLTISTIARGISFGDQIEFADELTLGKSILNRVLYNSGK